MAGFWCGPQKMNLVGVFIAVFVNLKAVSGQSSTTCFVGDIRLGQNPGSNTYIRATASNATFTITSFTASPCSTVSWSLNITQPATVVAQYNFGTNLPVYAVGYENGELTVSVTTIVAGQSNVTLQINNVSASQTGISVSASNSATISSFTLPLNVKNCETGTGSGVIVTPTSPLSCGFGCTVQYSCASGYTGNDVTATCQEDATFDAIPICTSITCPNTTLPCSDPRYCFIQTGSTNVTEVVTTQCNTGYSGNVSATCGNDGNWTITPQSPCPALCPVSDITSSPGRCTTATGDILEGQSITVTCCNGYEGASTMAMCTSVRSWSNLPTCTKAGSTKTAAPLSNGAIAGIVIGCIIVVAIIIVVLIAIFCAEICCCTFSILCLSWGTKMSTGKVTPDLGQNHIQYSS